jgi:hypothetical protein
LPWAGLEAYLRPDWLNPHMFAAQTSVSRWLGRAAWTIYGFFFGYF